MLWRMNVTAGGALFNSNSSGTYLKGELLLFFPDRCHTNSPLSEFICLSRHFCHSRVTVSFVTETKAAPLAKAPRSRVSFWYRCRRKCRSPRRCSYVKFFLFAILGRSQPVEICEKSDWNVSKRYCKHHIPYFDPYFRCF
jgi:hypothetical protein